MMRFLKITQPGSVSTNTPQYNVTRTVSVLSSCKQQKSNVPTALVHIHVIAKLAVCEVPERNDKCQLYISSEGTIQLSIQGMWTADSSHFISLITKTLKYVTTLSFTERPSGSPLPPHVFATNSQPAFRKSLVWFRTESHLQPLC